MDCSHCKSKNTMKAGKPYRSGKRSQRWQCRDCGRYSMEPLGALLKR